jgi:alpha-beta hydrolase superfamily lysophospholipase
MVISHGMAEHIGLYNQFARACNAQGIAVFAANHRGHGADAEILGHFADENGWDLLLSDLDSVIDFAATYRINALQTDNQQGPKAASRRPILLGHSMGSFAARHYAIRNGDKLASLILVGSNHQGCTLFRAGLFAAKVVRKVVGGRTASPLLEKLAFAQYNKGIEPLRTDCDWLSRDAAVVDAYVADPYCGFTPTAQFWVDLLGGLIEMSQIKAMREIPSTLPIYVISGSCDPVNHYGAGIHALAKALRLAGVNRVDCKLYTGGRHVILSETNKHVVHHELFDWLKQHSVS